MKAIADNQQKDWELVSKEIFGMIFNLQSFLSASFKFKEPVGPDSNDSLKIRIIQIKEKTLWQFVRANETENLSRNAGRKKLSHLLGSTHLGEAHITTTESNLHCRITKKGRVLVSRGRSQSSQSSEVNRTHDRKKDHPLLRFDSKKLLMVLDIADARGEIKPGMRSKFRQVNEFLRIVELAVDSIRHDNSVTLGILDAGCGKSYLSFSVKAYLEAVLGISVKLIGVDTNKKVIESSRRMAESLDWDSDEVEFLTCDIADLKLDLKPDVVMSLHACDTATDEAIAFGIENSVRAILCAPCCQHELQSQLGTAGPYRAILRNGILRERLADILTDSFRAQILRVMGYRTLVEEFIEPDATTKNIMIRAVRRSRAGAGTALAEYHDLREGSGCTPYLAKRLAAVCPELIS
jgi:hypothetical protein